MKKTTMLMILDGWGIGDSYPGNAISLAKTPVMDELIKTVPHTQIEASGLAVGLPEGQMGNSEVGHLNMGTGRVVYQDLTKITKEIKEGKFAQREELREAVRHAIDNKKALHLMGLLSDGGVHSHITHLFALLELCKTMGLREVYVHAFLDGRDVSPLSGAGFVDDLQQEMRRLSVGKIATVTGRYYAMDRDNRWERVQRAYDAIVHGKGSYITEDPVKAVKDSYSRNVTDEFVEPIVVMEEGHPVACLDEGDSVIFFNFRPDRGRELTRAITDPDFLGFERKKWFETHYVTMTVYDKTFSVKVVYPPETIEDTMGEYISKLGLTQLRIAETEKYPHVTFFFNGGREKVYENEDRILIPSPKVPTYDMQPEMSALKVCEKVLEAIRSGKYDMIILNFANSDMVGHTGVIPAAVQAVEVLDDCIGQIVQAIREVNGQMLITADHGNSEKMLESDGAVCTAHTTNPVPLFYIGEESITLKSGGKLSDITPTMLDMMHLSQPIAMTGRSLLERR